MDPLTKLRQKYPHEKPLVVCHPDDLEVVQQLQSMVHVRASAFVESGQVFVMRGWETD